MNKTPLLIAFVLALFVPSCTENKPPQQEQAQAQPRQNPFLQTLQQGQVSYSSNLNQPAQPNVAAPMGSQALTVPAAAATPPVRQAAKPTEPPIQIPPNAAWTIYVMGLATPDRFTTMQQFKGMLLSQTPFKHWYVVHGEQESTLFYGFYSGIDKNTKEGARAQADLAAIKGWQNPQGQRPFAGVFFTSITPPDPVAPAEWNLVNAPPGMYWSLQIGAYQGDARRKEYAVQAVKEARDRGIPAYYYHGPTISSVTVGMWPAKSVKEQESDGSKAEADPDSAVLVTNMPLPYKLRPNQSTDRDGQRLEILSQRVEVVDPTLLAAMREYPYHLVNGSATKRMARGVDGKPKQVISPSFLVVIPRNESNTFADAPGDNSLFGAAGGQSKGTAAGAATPEPYGQSAPAGAGKLRGLK
jgi:hypothetical protein